MSGPSQRKTTASFSGRESGTSTVAVASQGQDRGQGHDPEVAAETVSVLSLQDIFPILLDRGKMADTLEIIVSPL